MNIHATSVEPLRLPFEPVTKWTTKHTHKRLLFNGRITCKMAACIIIYVIIAKSAQLSVKILKKQITFHFSAFNKFRKCELSASIKNLKSDIRVLTNTQNIILSGFESKMNDFFCDLLYPSWSDTYAFSNCCKPLDGYWLCSDRPYIPCPVAL